MHHLLNGYQLRVDTQNGFTGSGANGAIIHYKPEPDSCSIVDVKKLFLLDSGAQYVDGTTDITRTVHFGEPTARQKGCFTRVLQVSCLLNCILCVICVCTVFLGRSHGWAILELKRLMMLNYRLPIPPLHTLLHCLCLSRHIL